MSNMTTTSVGNPAVTPSSSRAVMIWLFVMAALVFAMVVVGGITRLTGSGLSMVEWRPLMGILPPLNEAEWQRVYGLYQASPEYIHINTGIGIDGFKTIFFWEYVHRVLGRLIGLAFALPLAVFAVMKIIPKGYGLRLVVLLGLGGFQGLIGWWMVKSGLVDDPAVSQYRLATHLSTALIILGLLVWTALDLKDGKATAPRGHAAGIIGLLGITIIAGAFVAGMDAGKLYNEYPLMGDGFVPIEYGEMGASDAFENPASAQFHHRILALLMVAGIITLWHKALKAGLAGRGHAMLAAVTAQFLLGVMTLLYAVPVSLGTLHQAGAALLLMATVWVAHGLGRQAKS
ncbi:MAG: COX15/CtaA family protein [Alphaproteobacteria bacterium]|nr:COX15/CtaA family protein [Alphaproteobacteria bacterium]